jgi:hypothetical protein
MTPQAFLLVRITGSAYGIGRQHGAEFGPLIRDNTKDLLWYIPLRT